MHEDKSFFIVGHRITQKVIREVLQKAESVRWGTHLLRWRYFDVTHEGTIYHNGALIPTNIWHLLKRIYVDQDWPKRTSLENFAENARLTIQHHETEIYVFGYYRTDPPRPQWGFLNQQSGIAVIYDMKADLITTVFKPEEGEAFFLRQIDSKKIDRKEWNV